MKKLLSVVLTIVMLLQTAVMAVPRAVEANDGSAETLLKTNITDTTEQTFYYYIENDSGMLHKTDGTVDVVVYKENNFIGFFTNYNLVFAKAFDKNGNELDVILGDKTCVTFNESQSLVELMSVTGNANETIIFNFLKDNMGLNTAAACGILANIQNESSFLPTASGDGGTSYGICQWHNTRKTAMINWCKNNGYDYTSLTGQLNYLKYELSQNNANHLYNGKTIFNYISAVSNTADGAYDAGYYWCSKYEVPADTANVAAKRGTLAKNTYWVEYGSKEPTDNSYITERIQEIKNVFTSGDYKYFTTSGTSGCPVTDASGSGYIHDSCANCLLSNVVKSDWFKKAFGFTPGSGWNDQATGLWSCASFASFAHWYIFRTDNSTPITTSRISDCNNVAITTDNFAKLSIGDWVQVRYNMDRFHYFIFLGLEGNTVRYLDANGLNAFSTKYGENKGCIVQECTRTVSSFASSYNVMTARRADNYTPDESVSKDYTITFNPNGGYVSPTSKTVTNGETYGELPRPTRPGHTFVNWSTSAGNDGKNITSVSKVNLSENQTLYAKWFANALEYNANGGTGTLPETQKANSEGKVTLSSVVPVKEGYVFKGWGIHSLAEMKVYSPGETVILPLTNTVASAVWCAESIPEEKVIVFTDDKTSIYYQYHVVSGFYKDIDKTTYDNENGTINGVVSQNNNNTYDPMIYIPSLYFSANDYNYITINAKVEAEGTEQNNVQVFFTTESNTVLSESKSMHSWFSPEDENGYRDFSFEMYLNKEWDGTITSLRIDPFNDVTGTYSIKSITLSYKSPEEMEKGIKLDKTVLNLKQGESTTITATANSADTEITWISTNEDVATVKDGVVTAVGAGSAAIIAKNYGDALIEYIAGETYTTDSPAYVSSSEDIQIVENPLNKNDKVLYLETNQADKQAWTYFWYPCEYKPGQKYLVKFRIMPGYDFYGNKVSAPSVGINIHTNGSDKGVFWKPLAYGEWKEMACVYTVPEDIDVTKSMKFGIYTNPSKAIDSEQQVSYSYYLDNIMVIPYDGKLEDGEYDGASEEFTVAAAGCLVKVKAQHTVKYNANGGTNAPETQTWFDGDSIFLSSQIPVRQGYRFLGWALSPTGVVEIKPGAYLAHNDDLTLYAIWEANKYIITYDANGGKNPPANQTKTHGTALTLSLEKPTRDGYSFLGWALACDAIEPEYVPGATYMADEQVILYAVWEKAEVVTGTIDMSVSTVEAKAGDEVEIIIGVANHPGIESMEFDVEFDSTRLKYLSADLVSQKNDNITLDEFMFFMPNFATVIDSMTISLTTGTKNLVGDGDLLKIKFKVLDNAEDGFADVMVIPNIIKKIDGQTFEQQDIVPNIITNGGVEIISHLLGDLNNDGVVDLNDAILLLQHSMFPELYPLDYSGSVDFTCDGNIDLNDAILLLQYSMFPDLYPLPEDEVEEPEEDYIVKYDEAYSTGAKELRIATDPEDENNEVYYLKSDTGTTTSWTYFWLPANYKASERYVVEYDIYAVSDSLGNEIEEAYVSCGTCFSYGDFNENAGGGTTQHGSTIDGKSANVKVYPKEFISTM